MGIISVTIDGIVEMARAIWDFIKKITVRILRFTQNIVGYFKNPDRLRKLTRNRNLLAVTIKDNLANGNYNTVSCLFDKESNTIVDYDENAQGITAESLDEDTIRYFGDKDMLVLQ